ncbi:MAG: hypothetical protein LBD58_01065 [Treponema sp.]|jgi:hypothetical protein|nr:hypothetical protein [Treponema sp.]
MKMFYKLVFGALLAATLVLAGCEDGADLNATVNFPAIKAPNVTATAIQDGVKLEWDTDIDAASYVVYRRQDGGLDSVVTSNPSIDPVTGKKYVNDQQNASSNSVKANTKYTYTVRANPSSAHKESATKEVTVTTGAAFLAKGAELDPPAAVAIELLPDSNEIKATVTPGAHADLARGYWVSIYRDGQYVGGAWINYLETTGVYNWTPDKQISGTYTGRALTQNAEPETFYTSSKTIESAEKVFESLFGTDFSIDGWVDYVVTGTGATVTTVVNYSAAISLSGLKPGVTYSVERAPANKLGYATGDYATVTLSKLVNADYTAATADDLTPDHLGNVGNFYDRTLPAEAGFYVYRIKAVKGGTTQYRPKDGVLLSVDPKQYVSNIVEISVAAKDVAAAGVTKYAVTPSLDYKNILPDGSKLVIYWVKGDYSSYQYGKYSNTIEFSKAELEAATVAPKSIDVPDAGTGSYVYAQAYLEFADGTRKSLSSWNVWADGIYTTSSYYDSNDNYIFYAQFDY